MLECKDCPDNYLYKIYKQYLIAFENDESKAGEAFNKLCLEVRDPRNIIELINDITDGDCESCLKYKYLYKEVI
jgi:hypothetical protein